MPVLLQPIPWALCLSTSNPLCEMKCHPRRLLAILLLSPCFFANAQQATSVSKKETVAIRTTDRIHIDGILDEAVWQLAPVAGDFVQRQPNPGAPSAFRSEVRLAYDDEALFVGALLFDPHPDSIFSEMSERDQFGNADWFGIFIDAYQDGQNGFGFAVTPAGIEKDIKFSAAGGGDGGFGGILSAGDSQWDAVWQVDTRITNDGWVVEMAIPWSALRFPNAAEQRWGFNMAREVRRRREISFWNPIDPNLQGYLNQFGLLTGITHIEAPLRLSATPFLAVYAENFYDPKATPSSAWGRSINGGMDIKYGINDAFTLDMTLVPDFGQVRSDNEVLNLSPFEVRFDENRQFFTEGTELFNKGGLFYSRRVGGRPLHFYDVYDQLGENEIVLDNPAESQLINATKISGRNKHGLGIGVFNAISAPAHATILDTETEHKRKVQTNPLTNYNILVFDQNLPHNSYLSLINTNVWRSGADYEANVTGTRFQLRNRSQSLAFDGKAVLSQKYFPDGVDLGYNWYAGLSKTSGKIQWNTGVNVESYDYDPNDLGFIYSPNEQSFFAGISFNQNEPFGRFHEAHLNFDAYYQRLHRPDVFTSLGFGFEGWMVTSTRIGFGLFTWVEPLGEYDYFEPRTPDFSRYYRLPANFNIGGFVSTDYRKALAIDLSTNLRLYDQAGRYRWNVDLSPRYRFSNRFSLSLSLGSYRFIEDVGYVTTLDDGEIIIGIRDNITTSVLLNGSYIFNKRMSLSLRVRHYWSKAEYISFFALTDEGHFRTTSYDEFNDTSFNSFTVDAVYRWRFAPGSDIFIVWKNNTAAFDHLPQSVRYSYGSSLASLTDLPQRNSLSLKIIYYLDYRALKG